MKPEPTDESLTRLLRERCAVAPERNPEFRATVWARIEARKRGPATWVAWWRTNSLRFGTLAVASVMLAGVGGAWMARWESQRTREQLVQRYLASIDPHRLTGPEQR